MLVKWPHCVIKEELPLNKYRSHFKSKVKAICDYWYLLRPNWSIARADKSRFHLRHYILSKEQDTSSLLGQRSTETAAPVLPSERRCILLLAKNRGLNEKGF